VKLIPCCLDDVEGVSLPGREESRELSRVGVGVWPRYQWTSTIIIQGQRKRTKVGEHHPQIILRDPPIPILINHIKSLFELFDLFSGKHRISSSRGFSLSVPGLFDTGR
jgi:hypothetical protein